MIWDLDTHPMSHPYLYTYICSIFTTSLTRTRVNEISSSFFRFFLKIRCISCWNLSSTKCEWRGRNKHFVKTRMQATKSFFVFVRTHSFVQCGFHPLKEGETCQRTARSDVLPFRHQHCTCLLLFFFQFGGRKWLVFCPLSSGMLLVGSGSCRDRMNTLHFWKLGRSEWGANKRLKRRLSPHLHLSQVAQTGGLTERKHIKCEREILDSIPSLLSFVQCRMLAYFGGTSNTPNQYEEQLWTTTNKVVSIIPRQIDLRM